MIAHNAFAVPVLIPTIGVLDWTIGEIKDTDIKTRKILTLTRSFHPNSDVDRLYMQKSFGGRGLRQMQCSYESRIIAIRQHLIKNLHRNSVLEYIYEKETNDILRVGQESIKNTTFLITLMNHQNLLVENLQRLIKLENVITLYKSHCMGISINKWINMIILINRKA